MVTLSMLKLPPGSKTFTNKLALNIPGALPSVSKFGFTFAFPSSSNVPSKIVLFELNILLLDHQNHNRQILKMQFCSQKAMHQFLLLIFLQLLQITNVR